MQGLASDTIPPERQGEGGEEEKKAAEEAQAQGAAALGGAARSLRAVAGRGVGSDAGRSRDGKRRGGESRRWRVEPNKLRQARLCTRLAARTMGYPPLRVGDKQW